MTYSVKTYYLSFVNPTVQGGLATIKQARALAAFDLQDRSVDHAEIIEGTVGVQTLNVRSEGRSISSR